MKAIQIVEVPERGAFRVKSAAKYLGISPNTLRKRTDLGLIPARRDSTGARIYLVSDLNGYLEDLTPDPASAKLKLADRLESNAKERRKQ